MNAWRTLTAAGALLLAAAPTAQADNLAPALTGTALTLATAGERTGMAADEMAQRTGLAKDVSAVTDVVQAGAEAVSARDRSVDD
ncbi:MAG TPA: hypothetical protein DD420_33625 [Streptomyces sp.]|nr:hypothetical protein [Streptomyces sp.]